MKFRSLLRHELKIQFAYTISRFLNYIWSTQVPLEHAEIKSAAAALLRTWRPMGPFASFAVIYSLLTGLSFVYRHFTFGFLSLSFKCFPGSWSFTSLAYWRSRWNDTLVRLLHYEINHAEKKNKNKNEIREQTIEIIINYFTVNYFPCPAELNISIRWYTVNWFANWWRKLFAAGELKKKNC